MPVMLTYFKGSELKPVRPDYPDYEHLVNHVAVQLEGNDLHLFQTPIVLTLQGEFEDEEFNEVDPFQRSQHNGNSGSAGLGDEDSDSEAGDGGNLDEEEMEYDESAQEITLEELLRSEDFDSDEEDEQGARDDADQQYDEVGGEDEDGDCADEDSTADSTNHYNSCEMRDGQRTVEREDDPLLAFLHGPASQRQRRAVVPESAHLPSTTPTVTDTGNSAAFAAAAAAAGMIGTQPASAAQQYTDFHLHRPEQPDLSDIPPDALVTAEDTAGLQRAHRRADRIIEYATDMRLIGSFHYKKRNFHLVRLLEVRALLQCALRYASECCITIIAPFASIHSALSARTLFKISCSDVLLFTCNLFHSQSS
jgi:hypothetical protein